MERQNNKEQNKQGEESHLQSCILLEHSVNSSLHKNNTMCVKCNQQIAMSFIDVCFDCYIGVSPHVITFKKKKM